MSIVMCCRVKMNITYKFIEIYVGRGPQYMSISHKILCLTNTYSSKL